MIKKTIYLLSILVLTAQSLKAQHYENAITSGQSSIDVSYFENKPFAYTKNGELTGIEIDILNYFKEWLKENKNIDISYNYTKQENFNQLISNLGSEEEGKMAIGSISTTNSRKAKVSFTAPYMKNVSVLVSSGYIETMRSKEQIKEILPSLQAYSVQGSSHEDYLQKLYSDAELKLELEYVKTPTDILSQISEKPRSFGYVDVITFWSYLQSNEEYLKIHRMVNVNDEHLAFALPFNSRWQSVFDEFFESGFGFTATKDYRKILEKHLGYEILNTVELNP